MAGSGSGIGLAGRRPARDKNSQYGSGDEERRDIA